MKKKLITLMMIGTLSCTAIACGGNGADNTKSDTTVETTDPVEDETETSEPEVEEETATSESENTATGETEEQNGLRKTPVYTNKELNHTGETGPMKYSVDALQVSKLTATTDEMAEMLGVEKDKEVTLVVVDITVENTTDDTVYFYVGQATLTSNTKEQVDSDMLLSDYIDGEYLGNVIHSGSLMYILPNSSADDVTNLTLHISAPTSENFDTIGDEVKIELDLE